MYVTLHFDTEDNVYQPEEGVDEAPKWLAEIMTDVGLTGVFHVIGDKARAIRDRGRQDVAAAMARHDLGIHTDSNNHPLIPEMIQHDDWETGVAKVQEDYQKAGEVIAEVFGKEPVALSRHTNYTAPHVYAAAGKMGLPYFYGEIWPPAYDGPSWYAGGLSFPSDMGYRATAVNSQTYSAWGFDPACGNDELFARQLGNLEAQLAPQIEQGQQHMTLFLGHPVRFMVRGWTTRGMYANGRNRARQEAGYAYEVKTAAEVETAQRNFRRLCQYLRDREGVEVITAAAAAGLYSQQRSHLRREELYLYAQEAVTAGKPVLQQCFSPAEILLGLAENLLAGESRGALPRQVARREVLGPLTKPCIWPEAIKVSWRQFSAMLEELRKEAASGYLPADVHTADGGRVGIGSLLVASAKVFVAQVNHDTLAEVGLQPAPRYPDIADLMMDTMRNIEEGSFLDPAFDPGRLYLYGKLMTWSLKPAHVGLPAGGYDETGSYVPEKLVARDVRPLTS